jgi:hypothetical protein
MVRIVAAAAMAAKIIAIVLTFMMLISRSIIGSSLPDASND